MHAWRLASGRETASSVPSASSARQTKPPSIAKSIWNSMRLSSSVRHRTEIPYRVRRRSR